MSNSIPSTTTQVFHRGFTAQYHLVLLKQNVFDFQVYWTQNTSVLNCLLDWVAKVNSEWQKSWKYCRASLNSLSLEFSGEAVVSFFLLPFCSFWSCPPCSLWLWIWISTLFVKTFSGHCHFFYITTSQSGKWCLGKITYIAHKDTVLLRKLEVNNVRGVNTTVLVKVSQDMEWKPFFCFSCKIGCLYQNSS